MAILTANHGLATRTPGKALNLVLWTLQVLVALAFVAAGGAKLLGNSDMFVKPLVICYSRTFHAFI